MIPAELWAQEGLMRRPNGGPSIGEQAAVPDVEFNPKLIESLMRAAYAAGYQQALEDPEPLTYHDAIVRRNQLQLMLPVA